MHLLVFMKRKKLTISQISENQQWLSEVDLKTIKQPDIFMKKAEQSGIFGPIPASDRDHSVLCCTPAYRNSEVLKNLNHIPSSVEYTSVTT
jgi:hypothetical protein